VAPGLAEALVATLAGLIVAIPALIAFHYFAYQVRKFDYNLSILQEKFLGIVKQTFVK
jgi:biopolymer transport protein TolQ